MPRIDASNQSLSPLRNRIRHQLLPLLQTYNPRVTEALLRTARIAGDDIAFLDRESCRLWDEIAQRQENAIILNKERFLKLPVAPQRHLLRTCIEMLLGSLKDIETRHIEQIMNALTKPAGKRLSLPGGLVFSIEYDKYLLARDPAALSPFPILEDDFSLKIPGKTLLSGWCVEATTIDRDQMIEKDENFTAYFDLDKTGDRLVVRSRRPSDRFQPLGMSQTKKLGAFMIDAKIPNAWRQRIPIVCSPDHILWVVSGRIDDRAKVTENTKQVLRLEFKQVNP
jgi:tRNA(Ile)-lysidine synthase